MRIAALLLATLCLLACDDDDARFACENGHCYCLDEQRCEIPCRAPPCHVDCLGDESVCTAECGNGECYCDEGADCAFGCHSAPCHVDCEAGSTCTGTCENGTCRCARGASCAFDCGSGPCHVQCEGDNARCEGECSNGTCACGPNGSCSFKCLDGNCSATCAEGASCVLECPSGRTGEAHCDFDRCEGARTQCPSGETVTCDAPCPS